MAESKPHRPTPEEASAALVDAEARRATPADDIATPSWLFVSLGVAICRSGRCARTSPRCGRWSTPST